MRASEWTADHSAWKTSRSIGSPRRICLNCRCRRRAGVSGPPWSSSSTSSTCRICALIRNAWLGRYAVDRNRNAAPTSIAVPRITPRRGRPAVTVSPRASAASLRRVSARLPLACRHTATNPATSSHVTGDVSAIKTLKPMGTLLRGYKLRERPCEPGRPHAAESQSGYRVCAGGGRWKREASFGVAGSGKALAVLTSRSTSGASRPTNKAGRIAENTAWSALVAWVTACHSQRAQLAGNAGEDGTAGRVMFAEDRCEPENCGGVSVTSSAKAAAAKATPNHLRRCCEAVIVTPKDRCGAHASLYCVTSHCSVPARPA